MPVGSAGESPSQSVFFYVGFIHDVESERIAKFIPSWSIRIVARTHGIHIGLLHELDILYHKFVGHNAGGLRIVLVAVHTTETNRPTVDQHLPVLDLNAPEADLAVSTLNDLPVSVA